MQMLRIGNTLRPLKGIAAFSIACMLLALAGALPARASGPVWRAVFSAGGKLDDRGTNCVADAGGNLYVIGDFTGTVSFGSQTLTTTAYEGGYLAKFSPAGEVLWVRSLEASSGLVPWGLALDSAGNVVIDGWYAGRAQVGGATLDSIGTIDIFLAKYGADGSPIWGRAFGGDSMDIVFALAVTPDGDYVISGDVMSDTVIYGGVEAGSGDGLVARFDADGNPKWSRRLSGRNFSNLVVGRDSVIYVAGAFTDTLVFADERSPTKGGDDIFVGMLRPDGSQISMVAIGGPQDDLPMGLAVNDFGQVVLTGVYGHDLSINGVPLPHQAQGGSFIAEFDGEWSLAWMRSLGGSLGGHGRRGGDHAVRNDSHYRRLQRLAGTGSG